ncbi:MAG: DUF2281 domain-containing protein [Oscillospiraceae bacterium]|nr:DUF2281 domain-containing protein [Oscillospiraceae bacterium]
MSTREYVKTNIDLLPAEIIEIFASIIRIRDVPEKSKIQPKRTIDEFYGCMRGQFEMADDFDAPLDDFKEYM